MQLAHWLIRDVEPGARGRAGVTHALAVRFTPPAIRRVGERLHAAMPAPGRPLAAGVNC